MTPGDAARLACPSCRGVLSYRGTQRDGHLDDGALECRACAHAWTVRRGLPHLYDDARVPVADRFFRLVYDVIAPFHDLGVRWVLPLLQGTSEEATRARYLDRMELDRLAPGDDGAPLRILEVGIGAGANVGRLERALPLDVDAEIWGLDLSEGMMGQCRRSLARHAGREVKLLLADAHALPFPDGTFDRVFHVGAIASYGDQARALAEMARVARADTPIVVVDEQLDAEAARSIVHWATFRALTIYDRDPHAPVEHLPAGADRITVEQVSRFYYCMTFRMPAPPRAPTAGGNAPMALPPDVTKVLSAADLAALRAGYVDADMVKALSVPMPAEYPGSQALVSAVQSEFYGSGDGTTPQSGTSGMSALERERILVALLASRGGTLTLAIHMYVALMNRASPGDIASILLLTGVYTGIDRLAEGLAVQEKLFAVLRDLVAANRSDPTNTPLDVLTVCAAISARFTS